MMVMSMIETKVNDVSNEYAIALFDLAKENKEIDLVYQNLKVLVDSSRENNDFLKIINSFTISTEEKKKIIKDILNLKEENYFLYFLYVLIDNNRFDQLGNILSSYYNFILRLNNQMEVTVYTKYSLTKEQRKNLTNKLEKDFNKKIILTEIVDNTLTGGLKLVTNDLVYDYTIDGQLKELKDKLMKG